jgi:ornithine lipid hydroxylase
MDQRSRTRLALTLLTLLFLGRVIGQLFGRLSEVTWLPPDGLWHAAVVPYPALLATQIAVLTGMALAIWRLDRLAARPVLAVCLGAFGTAYGLVMLVRGIMGATGLTRIAWFDAPIATPFHLVLAGWLLVLAHHLAGERLRRRWSSLLMPAIRTTAYPALMIGCCALFFWLMRHSVPLKFAGYLPVLLGATAILVLELLVPYRPAWTPRRDDVVQDGTFLVVVQIALPALLAVVVLDQAAGLLGTVPRASLWPHAWPIAAQALLMLLSADLFRYWLHRASHGWPPLWRLHAVHHSPQELYFLNVGRFHPVEKLLQFLVDAAPFLLIGVAPEVVAAYFVFYAVNGFFQHCNADVRLGWLNWIVSGPELHRWHHSRTVRESDRNFGNNLILWDALFGTRFLPVERQVGELGLKNRRYPKNFIAQTLVPNPYRE